MGNKNYRLNVQNKNYSNATFVGASTGPGPTFTCIFGINKNTYTQGLFSATNPHYTFLELSI